VGKRGAGKRPGHSVVSRVLSQNDKAQVVDISVDEKRKLSEKGRVRKPFMKWKD